MTTKQLRQLIWLSGSRGQGYTVHVSRFDGMDDIDVHSASVGHAIVGALRALAEKHGDWFPIAQLERVGVFEKGTAEMFRTMGTRP